MGYIPVDVDEAVQRECKGRRYSNKMVSIKSPLDSF